MAKKVARKASKAALGGSIRGVMGRGQGVDTLIPKNISSDEELQKVAKTLANTIANIPIDQIERNPDQPRKEFIQEALDELAGSIGTHGIIQPITVRRLADSQYQIISGERRWRASQLAGLKEVPAYVRVVDNQQLLEMAIVENVQREDLNPFEFVTSLARLKKEFNLTDKEVAEKVGKGRATVTNYLRVLELEPAILNFLHDGELTLGHAKSLAGIKDKVLRKELFTDTIENQLSVRALEAKIKASKEPQVEEPTPAPAKKTELSTEYAAVQKTLKDFFGNGSVKIKVDEEKGKGQIVVPFSSVQELNRMLDLLEGN
jgi:ParB family chromosome partitioning protein